jgi:peptidoglycan/LPS O-acetylase OafA/YrhL
VNKSIPELDGIRGLAIIFVLLFHFGARPPGVPRILTAPFALGWSGVDLFFVLSGFLITGILIHTRETSNYFSSFYARRVLRIFPLYVLTIVAYFHIALPIAHYFGHWGSWHYSLEPWYWFHVSNWQSAFGSDIPLLTHYWSLAIEEQFYLVWPVVVFFVPNSKLPYFCLMLIALAFGLRCAFQDQLGLYPSLLFRLTPFRMDSLAFGGLLATIVRHDGWSAAIDRRLGAISTIAGLMLVGILTTARTNSVSNPLVATCGFTTFGLLYSCFVFHAYVHSGSQGWVVNHLRHPLVRSFGKYSYGMYVLHFPVCVYQNRLLLALSASARPEFRILFWAVSKLVGVAVSYALALGSWHLIEKHFLRLKGRFRAAPTGVGARVEWNQVVAGMGNKRRL